MNFAHHATLEKALIGLYQTLKLMYYPIKSDNTALLSTNQIRVILLCFIRSEISFVTSNRIHTARSFMFETSCMILDQIALLLIARI